MSVGQNLFVQGGGYYSVSSIGSGTTVTVTNLGYAGNAAAASTVTGAGTQKVVPAGTQGSAAGSSISCTGATCGAATALSSVQIVTVKIASLAASMTVGGLPFTSATSYMCHASFEVPPTKDLGITYTSGTTVSLAIPSGWSTTNTNLLCVGN